MKFASQNLPTYPHNMFYVDEKIMYVLVVYH